MDPTAAPLAPPQAWRDGPAAVFAREGLVCGHAFLGLMGCSMFSQGCLGRLMQEVQGPWESQDCGRFSGVACGDVDTSLGSL